MRQNSGDCIGVTNVSLKHWIAVDDNFAGPISIMQSSILAGSVQEKGEISEKVQNFNQLLRFVNQTYTNV